MSPRLLAATLLLLPVALPAPVLAAATKATDWQTVVAATPEGGFRIGNPAAPVKVIEYASLTCPTCARFHADSMAALRTKYIAGGKVSFEFRNFILNGPDYAASMLARCEGPKGFFPLVAAFFGEQPRWTAPFAQQTEADKARITAQPAERQLAAIAEAGKLDGFVAPRGVTRARFDACLVDKAGLDRLLAMRKDAVDTFKLNGTPGFIINGKTQDGVLTWAALEPLVQAALRP